MSVLDILTQRQDSYGKPNMMTNFRNETLYRSQMAPSDSSEVLFHRIEQCQEVQIIGKVPFTTEQIIVGDPQNVFSGSVWALPHLALHEKHVGPKWLCKPKYVQRV